MPSKNSLVQYWTVYGGWESLLRSFYLWFSVAASILLVDLWWVRAGDDEPRWVEKALDVIPGMLGFVLGGMAILLAFSTDKFLSAIKQGGKDDSYFMKVMASFFHLAVVLVIAIILSIVCEPDYLPIALYRTVSGFGFFFSFYAILLGISTVSAIWHTARIFNKLGTGD